MKPPWAAARVPAGYAARMNGFRLDAIGRIVGGDEGTAPEAPPDTHPTAGISWLGGRMAARRIRRHAAAVMARNHEEDDGAPPPHPLVRRHAGRARLPVDGPARVATNMIVRMLPEPPAG